MSGSTAPLGQIGKAAEAASHPPREDIIRAWEIHKDSDALLHSRLASFASSQSFLVTGYVIAVANMETPTSYLSALSYMIASLGLLYAVIFLAVCSFLVSGLRRLKKKYLRFDPVYYSYYSRVIRVDDFEGERRQSEGWKQYAIPLFLPGLAALYWIAVIVLRTSWGLSLLGWPAAA